ncbi:MAG: Nramp family divalent metal transporter [Thermomicrobiales bacterium]
MSIRLPAMHPRGRFAALAFLGPGLIAASAGNDAGGIATYSSIGADLGYDLLWAIVLITISLAIVQEMAARMGAVTGKGFSDLVREQFGVRITALIMSTLLIANAGLVVSEFAGIAAAAELFGISHYIAVPIVGLLLWLLVLRGSYAGIEKAFLALTLVFLAYPIAAVLSNPDWSDVARHLVRPTFQLSARKLTLLVAMIGTTITPYMQLYLQSAVAERSGRTDPRLARIDAYAGAIFSNFIAAAIIIATGATLYVQGVSVESAKDAADALEPIVGRAAPYIFGAGLFGASILAAAVLPIATAYTVTEAFGFEKGVSRSFREAPVFHVIFGGLLALGALAALIPGLNVIDLLVSTQVLNGLVLPVVLIAIVLLVNDRVVMRGHTNSRAYNIVAWATVIVVAVLSTVYLGMTVFNLSGLG